MKKIYFLWIAVFFFLFSSFCYASTNTMDRRTLDDYGVHKKWDITGKNINNVLRTPYVDASERVYDFASILTQEEEEQLLELIQEYEEETGFTLVFLSDNFSYHNDDENETYATDFYDYNDFAIDEPLYSGVIFFRNTNVTDPYFGMYTFGNAQLYYDQNRVNAILDSIYSDIKSQNYMEGLDAFVDYLTTYYQEGVPSYLKDSYVDDMGYVVYVRTYQIPWVAVFIVAILGTTGVMAYLIHKNKMIRKAYQASEYLVEGSIHYSVRKDQFIRSHTTSHTISSSSGGSSGGHSGGGSHSGSSGGGHGSGGRHG